jgi:hypothetical protein
MELHLDSSNFASKTNLHMILVAILLELGIILVQGQ